MGGRGLKRTDGTLSKLFFFYSMGVKKEKENCWKKKSAKTISRVEMKQPEGNGSLVSSSTTCLPASSQSARRSSKWLLCGGQRSKWGDCLEAKWGGSDWKNLLSGNPGCIARTIYWIGTDVVLVVTHGTAAKKNV